MHRLGGRLCSSASSIGFIPLSNRRLPLGRCLKHIVGSTMMHCLNVPMPGNPNSVPFPTDTSPECPCIHAGGEWCYFVGMATCLTLPKDLCKLYLLCGKRSSIEYTRLKHRLPSCRPNSTAADGCTTRPSKSAGMPGRTTKAASVGMTHRR